MKVKKGSIEINAGKTDESLEILSQAPPGAPGWALGLAFLAIVFLSNFVSTWLAVSPDVKLYLANRKELDLATVAAKQTYDREERETLLSLAAKHSEQYSMLARSLEGMAARAAESQREVGSLRAQLDACRAGKVTKEAVQKEVEKQVEEEVEKEVEKQIEKIPAKRP